MPIYEYECLECGQRSEILVTSPSVEPRCRSCGSGKVKKLLSAHASPSVSNAERLPGPGDTTCCGSSPGVTGCTGPGSRCGEA